jgi:maleylacetoacetate isomerase
MELYSFFRSTASFRVRIALALKGLSYRTISINLLREDGENNSPSYGKVNPQHLVPSLVTDDGYTLIQSGAICEYLEERYPSPPLLPRGVEARAYVRALMAAAACDIHPLHAIRVTKYLERQLHIDAESRKAWTQHWILEGLQAIDAILERSGLTGAYCYGDTATLADAFIVPQFVSALANGVSVESLSVLPRIAQHCLEHAAFQAALPQNQPGANPVAPAQVRA